MSVYDQRSRSAYGNFQAKRSYARNKHILKWWNRDHDDLIIKQIEKAQWMWYWGITDSIVSATSEDILEEWKRADPLCSQYAWYNILMNFAAARAEILGLNKRIRKPEWKTCPLCGQGFVEDSLPYPLVQRLGIDHLDYCAPCLSSTIFPHSGNPNLSKEAVIVHLQDLANALQRVPSQGFGEGVADFHGMDDEQRLAVLKVLQEKPTTARVKELFGSWLKALIEAEILEDGTRRTARGIQTLAQDGHVCLSLGEKTIDDFLFSRGIRYEKEPRYPESNYPADFLVDGVFVEYFGLKGNPEYDAKTRLKQGLCRKHGIRLISIYPADLISVSKLEKKLAPILHE